MSSSASTGYLPPSQQTPHARNLSVVSAHLEDDSDEDGLKDGHHDILSEDPLDGDLEQTNASRARPGRGLRTMLATLRGATQYDTRDNASDRIARPSTPPMTHASYVPSTDSPRAERHAKFDGDWHAEGPGRRVRYEDLTAIDWIFEYTKERQRLRLLRSGVTGALTYLRIFFDASQVWLLLVLTGIATGSLAASIDITSDWLGDLKTGFCSSGPDGGRFYLNRYFCCFGYDEWAQCQDWISWSSAMHVSSTGGKWLAEYMVFILLSVGFALAAALLVKEYAMYAKHSGIPEIKTVLGGFVIRRFLSTWTLVVKSLGLCLSVASGMWLGKEGPLVHVACCCANLFMKLFSNINGNEARKREVLSAAASAGISVAFGSPIGGVLFSLEQLSYYFPDKTMWQSFVCAMTAAVTLQAFDPFRSGKLVLYQVTYTSGWHDFELVPFCLLGVIGGIYGGLLIKLNMRIAQWKRSTLWLPGPVFHVAAVALLTALVNFPNLYMRAQSTELVYSLFAECANITDDQFGLCKTGAASGGTILLLLLASGLGFLLATITFGLQLPAGILLPTMAIGALLGRALGIIMEIWVDNFPDAWLFEGCEPDKPCINVGTYAIIGAAGALGGVTRMTVSIVVIMFELTGALTYVLPIMIAVMLGKWVGDAFEKRGIYESWIHLNQYPYLDNNDDINVPDIPVSQIMTRYEDLVVLTATGHTIGSLNDILSEHAFRGFPVVSDDTTATILGYISRAELSHSLQAASQTQPLSTKVYFIYKSTADPNTTLDLRPWMDQTPFTLPPAANLLSAANYFQKLGVRYILCAERGAMRGLLTKKDYWLVLNGAEESRRKDTSEGVAVSTGITREDGHGEARGLLHGDDEDDAHEGLGRGSGAGAG